jgi:predicted RNase H-like HicB family nuclease
MKRFSFRRGFANEGGYWAEEVPAIPGCATEGDSWDELIANLHEAIEGCLSVDRSQLEIDDKYMFKINYIFVSPEALVKRRFSV